jgi:O-antigen ligase
MIFSLYGSAFLVAFPWLFVAMPGPVPQLGSWLAAVGVLAGMLSVESARCWPRSLVMAAVLSICIASLQFAGVAASLAPWVSESLPGEMVANLRQRNQFATLMAIGLLALLYGLLARAFKLSGRSCFWIHGLTCSAAVALAFGNALSGSRTGLLQLLAIACLAWVWRHSWGSEIRWALGTALVAYGLGVLLAPGLAEIMGHGNTGLMSRLSDTGGSGRLVLWSNALELIAQQPLLGHSWRSLAYVHYANEFSGTRFMEMLDNAHNLPLHLAVELGLPVALGFCGLVGWLIWKSRPWAEARADRQLAWGILMVIGIHSLLEYPLWYGPFFMTTLICIGVLCSDLWRNWLLVLTEYTRAAIILGVRSLGFALLALTAFAAFDYHRVSQIYLQPEERSSWYADDALGAAQKSVLFKSHAKFAELTITPLSQGTATRVFELSSELVRWSPEPRVIEKLIESSVMLGVDDVAAFHIKRYKVAYPLAYAAWAAQRTSARQLPS